MDLPSYSGTEKKTRSFWNRLLRLPRKSNQIKEKHEDSFRRQSILYSSLSTTKHKTPENNTSDESENFTTIECSAFMDVHKDAGILFLNKNSEGGCFAPKEENKHVQFAPTPMNKYYKVDPKSAPSKIHEDENKENVEKTKSVKPSRSILRLDKSHKIFFPPSSAEETQSNIETRLVNVTYINGPEVKKTPLMPRTSTKLALIDRNSGSLSQLNVSSIQKHGSLPRNSKITEYNTKTKTAHTISQFSDTKSMESLKQTHIKTFCPDTECCRKSVRDFNAHRQSCYGVSDPSRLFEGKKVLEAQYNNSSQNMKKRLSLGRPPLYPSHTFSNSSYPMDNVARKSHLIQDAQKKVKSFFNVPQSSRSLNFTSLDGPKESSAFQTNYRTGGTGVNALNLQYYHTSTGHIPNKAINEVGLPLVSNIQNKEPSANSGKSGSISTQYIHLSETTSNKTGIKKKLGIISKNSQQVNTTESFNGPLSAKQRTISFPNTSSENATEKLKLNSLSTECYGDTTYVSEKRKQVIRSTMYSQKRQIMNKVCKYNTKDCEEGFSSMADDECSFNCSCPSCVSKLSRSYKRHALRNFLPHSRDNKYFFTIEPDILEGNEIQRLPENQTFEGPMAKAQPHLSNKNEDKLASDKTWYECNDTLCETPNKNKYLDKVEKVSSDDTPKTPTNKIVDNIYENITHIINSATKSNLKPRDIKKMLSTPICSPVNIQFMSSISKTKKSSFPEQSDEKYKALNQSLKEILTPIRSSNCFNDSVVLLQEIFQKLSEECRELLQPDISASTSDGHKTNDSVQQSVDGKNSKYVSDLLQNLKSSELSEADFANIIGGIAQNIFSETKAKRKVKRSVHSTSLPDLQKKELWLTQTITGANSLTDLCNLKSKSENNWVSENSSEIKADSVLSAESAVGSRQLPDGWSRTPTTESSNLSNNATCVKLLSSETDNSKCSESEMKLLENAIRRGMGLPPLDKVKRTTAYAASPTKATKYKSRDVLSGKGKLKLKIYYNSGLVTVYVIKASKLNWTNNRDLNAYVKITMIPDEAKRVHWRTSVQKAQKNPTFNQKFSFELLNEDVTKRLVFSVWHRDYAKQRSELIGCMSFSVRHVMDNNHNVDGWYRLLRERFGTQKHFAAHTCKDSCSFKVSK